MRPGEKWRGYDGTEYLVVNPQEVRQQPRWWIDEPPEPGDHMLGPAHPGRLHKVPLSMMEGPRKDGKRDQMRFALVLPS
jgi:hypothetical protein